MSTTSETRDRSTQTFGEADAIEQYRSALGSFATGVTILCARDENGDPVGVTANSFSSVSLAPPLVVWSLSANAYSRPVFEAAEHFSIHVLGADQTSLAKRFATQGSMDKFAGVSWAEGHGGTPILPGAIAHFECERYAVHDGGDHRMFLGRVLKFSCSPRPALAFHRGDFAECSPLKSTSDQ